MPDIPIHAARLPTNATLVSLDPVFGPIVRDVADLALGESVLVQSDGILCFRTVQDLAPVAAPETVTLIGAGSLAPDAPSSDLILDTQQRLGLPQAASPLASARPQPANLLQTANLDWRLVQVENAERLIANHVAIATGTLSPRPCRSMPESIRVFAGRIELQPLEIESLETGAVFYFHLPRSTRVLRLLTPHNSPVGDIRNLGVAVTGMSLDGDLIALDSPILARGFHQVEFCEPISWRWTDGDAWLLLQPKPTQQSLAIAITNWHLA